MSNIINTIVYEDFTVLDTNYSPVTGLDVNSFSVDLINSNGIEVSNTITVTIVELSNGAYRASFIPTISGPWYLTVYHPVYFPWGKSNDIHVDSVSIEELIANIPNLVLSQPISGYSEGSVGHALDVIYEVESGRWSITNNQMIFYKHDNITELFRFELRDAEGNVSSENVFDRLRL